MSDDHGYQGWTNYETWAVNLWIDNEEETHTRWRTMARAAFVDAEKAPPLYSSQTASDRARVTLAALLKQDIEAEAPDLGASMFADLLNAALSEVDWYEIADTMLAAELTSYETKA